MLLIFGVKDVLFKRSWALRLEMPVQIFYAYKAFSFHKILNDISVTVIERTALFDFL